jgi:rubrerythrin
VNPLIWIHRALFESKAARKKRLANDRAQRNLEERKERLPDIDRRLRKERKQQARQKAERARAEAEQVFKDLGEQIREGFRWGIPLIDQGVHQMESRSLVCPACGTSNMGGWIQPDDESVRVRCPTCSHTFAKISFREFGKGR